jgi:ribonuclease BN (tRNA processing enzyme)
VEHPASREVYATRGGRVPRQEPRFNLREIAAGDRIETGSAVVTAGMAIHLQPMMDCLTYRVDWDGGAVVFTGDTGRHEGIEKLAEGATTLVVNVWDHQENMSAAITSGFCGTLDAARMAAAAGVQRLVIAHQTPGLALQGSREKAIADMAAVFKGEIVFGEEFMSLKLK